MQYADDSTLVLSDFDSPKKVILLTELYGMVSGARLNKEKSREPWKGQTYKHVPIQWSSSFHTFYGVTLGNDNYLEENYNSVITKML